MGGMYRVSTDIKVNFKGWNNARPINEGQCCDVCNKYVINRRINDLLIEGLRK